MIITNKAFTEIKAKALKGLGDIPVDKQHMLAAKIADTLIYRAANKISDAEINAAVANVLEQV